MEPQHPAQEDQPPTGKEPRQSRRHAFAGRIKFALRPLTAREPSSGAPKADAEISPVFVDPDQVCWM